MSYALRCFFVLVSLCAFNICAVMGSETDSMCSHLNFAPECIDDDLFAHTQVLLEERARPAELMYHAYQTLSKQLAGYRTNGRKLEHLTEVEIAQIQQAIQTTVECTTNCYSQSTPSAPPTETAQKAATDAAELQRVEQAQAAALQEQQQADMQALQQAYASGNPYYWNYVRQQLLTKLAEQQQQQQQYVQQQADLPQNTTVDPTNTTANYHFMEHRAWEDQMSFCMNLGLELCPSRAVCPRGRQSVPQEGMLPGDVWCAVADSGKGNEYISVGDAFQDRVCVSFDKAMGRRPDPNVMRQHNIAFLCCRYHKETGGYEIVKETETDISGLISNTTTEVPPATAPATQSA
eukprot:GILK01004158.1.p1 GENE.GILK01004158.1~~GILK01004158.1.p1  ORF type:complete len:362 (-),score=53.50 GILK01004158.1:247-1293(-)